MKLRRPEPATPQESIVPLIDVVFFLLSFFMLVGRMDATAPFEVLPPPSRSGLDMPAGGMTLSVAVDGVLALDGTRLSEAALLERIRTAPPRFVRLNAHRESRAGRVLRLVALLEAAGVAEVAFVVTPEE